MAGEHTGQEEYHNRINRGGRKAKGRTARRKIQNKNVSGKKICHRIQKSVLLALWALFAIVGIREIAYKIVDGITVNRESCYKSAVSGEREETKNNSINKAVNIGKSGVQSNQQKATDKEKIKAACNKIYEKNRQLLVLVNRDKILNENYNANLRSICNGRLQASEKIYSDLVEMLSDAGKAGYSYWIASAYRSRQRQQELVDEDVNAFVQKGMTKEQALEKTYEETNPAGYSEHETGLALDILCSNNMNMDISQEKEEANIWLQEHCCEYGFILRYPKDKVDITKINYEPWHFRYVGKEAAEFMKEHDMVLEEFYDILEKDEK